ncbi:MAG: hypothetical protein NT040_08735 [Bacteroidetes bacterium]|nr:hypothetical protein [Bacteroidota bacterium]
MPLEKYAYNFVSNIPFNPSYYLNNNSDVNNSVNGSYMKAFAHWLDDGIMEGRDSTNYFNSVKYLGNPQNGDLLAAFGPGNYKAGVLHWIQFGKAEGRKGN